MTGAASGSHCVINDCYARCIRRYSLSPRLLLNGSVTMACICNLSVFPDGSEQVSVSVSVRL